MQGTHVKSGESGIRIRKPTVKDVDAIFNLNKRMADRGLMLHRDRYKILEMLGNFLVAENAEGKIVGCGALGLVWTDLGEVMALAVDDDYQGLGVGGMIVGELIKIAEEFKLPEIITLTYQTEFFKNLGFTLTAKDNFPKRVWRICLDCPKLEECDENALHIILRD